MIKINHLYKQKKIVDKWYRNYLLPIAFENNKIKVIKIIVRNSNNNVTKILTQTIKEYFINDYYKLIDSKQQIKTFNELQFNIYQSYFLTEEIKIIKNFNKLYLSSKIKNLE